MNQPSISTQKNKQQYSEQSLTKGERQMERHKSSKKTCRFKEAAVIQLGENKDNLTPLQEIDMAVIYNSKLRLEGWPVRWSIWSFLAGIKFALGTTFIQCRLQKSLELGGEPLRE